LTRSSVGGAPVTSEGAVELDVVGGRVTIPGQRTVGVLDLRVVGDGETVGGVLGQTAANLFDPGESAVEPGDPVRIADLGRVGPPQGASALTARNEWWWPLALAAFVLLLAEWILFHRPTRRAVARLLQRRPGTGTRRQRRPSSAGSG